MAKKAKKAAKPKNEPSTLRPMPPVLIDLAELQDPWGAVWLANGEAAATKQYEKAVEKFEEKKDKGKGKGKEPEMREPMSMGRFDKKQGMDFGGVLDKAFAHALAEMVGGVPVMSPINNSLLPPDPNCVELGKTRIVGGIRPQNYDAAYRPDGPRVVYDSKTLNDTKSIGKNWQNMVNDLATEASTVHTRFPYCIVAFIVAMPRPALKGPQERALIRTLERLGDRDDELDQNHLAEAIAFVVWDPVTGEIDPNVPPPDSILRIEAMPGRIYPAYLDRYKNLPPHEAEEDADETEKDYTVAADDADD